MFATSAQIAAVLIFDTLTYLDEKGEPQPKLALSRTHSDDYKTWNRVADDIPSPLKCAHLEKCSVFSYKLFHTEIDF